MVSRPGLRAHPGRLAGARSNGARRPWHRACRSDARRPVDPRCVASVASNVARPVLFPHRRRAVRPRRALLAPDQPAVRPGLVPNRSCSALTRVGCLTTRRRERSPSAHPAGCAGCGHRCHHPRIDRGQLGARDASRGGSSKGGHRLPLLCHPLLSHLECRHDHCCRSQSHEGHRVGGRRCRVLLDHRAEDRVQRLRPCSSRLALSSI